MGLGCALRVIFRFGLGTLSQNNISWVGPELAEEFEVAQGAAEAAVVGGFVSEGFLEDLAFAVKGIGGLAGFDGAGKVGFWRPISWLNLVWAVDQMRI